MKKLFYIAIALCIVVLCISCSAETKQEWNSTIEGEKVWEFKLVSISNASSYEDKSSMDIITGKHKVRTAPEGSIYKMITVECKNVSDKEVYLDPDMDSMTLYLKEGSKGIKEVYNNNSYINYTHLGSGEKEDVTFIYEVPSGTKISTGAYIKYSGMGKKTVKLPIAE